MRESDIEDHLVKRVKAMGGEVRKVQWIGRRGAPDRLVMLPALRIHVEEWDRAGLYVEGVRQTPEEAVMWVTQATIQRTVWVELKAPGVEPKAHQLREHKRMRAMGQRVVVIDSIEGVEELLR